MKTFLKAITIIAFVVFLSSCVSKSKFSELEENYEIMEQKYQEKDSSLTRLISYLDTLSSSIELVTHQENVLALGINEDGTRMNRADQKANIELLANLLEDQRATIQRLEERIASKDSTVKQLKVLINGFYAQLAEKDKKIKQLRADLEKSKTQVAHFSKEVEKLQDENAIITENLNASTEVISNQDKMLNTAYFFVGTKKELTKAGIITAFNKIHLDKINTNDCVEVDIRTFTELNLPESRSVKIMTQHPSSSYSLFKNNDNTYTLSIFSPSSFWDYSPYLVIMTN